MWALGKILKGTPEVPKLVVGSFWDAEMPFDFDEDVEDAGDVDEDAVDDVFGGGVGGGGGGGGGVGGGGGNYLRRRAEFLKAETKSLLERLAKLPDRVVARKMDEMSKRLVQLKVIKRQKDLLTFVYT